MPPLNLLVVGGEYVADSMYGWESESNWLSAPCLVNLSFHIFIIFTDEMDKAIDCLCYECIRNDSFITLNSGLDFTVHK